MAKSCRNNNLLLLIGVLLCITAFYGCGGGGSNDDPLPGNTSLTTSITGKITSSAILSSFRDEEKGNIRAAINAANVEVFIESNRTAYNTRTDAEGKYVLTGVPLGTHRVVAIIKTATGKTYKVRSGEVAVSSAGTAKEATTLLLQQATYNVTGIIKDSNGNPMPNAPITLWGETFYTDASGKFASPLMPNGVAAELKCMVPGYQQTVIPVTFNSPTPQYIEQTIVPTSSTNRPPTSSLSATNYELQTRQQVSLTATAQDPDGGNLTYAWSATSGTIATSSNPLVAVWTAPDVETVATISFTAMDSGNLTTTSHVSIKVGNSGTTVPGANHSPVILGIVTASSTFLNNMDYTLTANATDSDGDALTYFWSTAQGGVSPTDQISTTWRTPNVNTTTYVQVSVLVSDNRGGAANRTATFTVSPNPNPPANTSPVVTISSPASNTILVPGEVVYRGSATDVEDGTLGADSMVWYQGIEGMAPTKIGEKRSEIRLQVLTPATYVVTLQVSDLLGAESQSAIKFRINATPTASISAPLNNSVFQLGQTINFTGVGNDVEDVLVNSASLSWKFPTQTLTGTNPSVNNLTAGSQTIELTATDRHGGVSAKNSIQVYINTPPVASITSPASGSVFLTSQEINLNVNVTDVDGTIASNSIQWLDGSTLIARGYACKVSTLTAGVHRINLNVADSMGGQTSGSLDVIINQRPTMVINQPVNNAVVFANQALSFMGSGNSIFGSVSSSTMVWEDYNMVSTSTISTAKAQFSKTYLNTELGKHIITLTGRDQYGAASYTQHSIFVNATPTVAITDPASGTRFNLGAPITFKSSKSDPDPTDALTIRWLDGTTPIGTTDNLTTSALTTGNHNIFCEVTDSHGTTSVASISVLVNTLPVGTFTWNYANQYATAPSQAPVFISANPSMELTFGFASYDQDTNGTVEAISVNNVKWYNTVNNNLTQIGTGAALTTTLPIGLSTITVELFDTYYPTYGSQAKNSYSMQVHVWQSVSYNSGAGEMAANPKWISGKGSGKDADLGLVFDNGPTNLAFKAITFHGNFGTEWLETKQDLDIDASYLGFSSLVSSVRHSGKMVLLGIATGAQTIYYSDMTATTAREIFTSGSFNTPRAISSDDNAFFIANTGANNILLYNPNGGGSISKTVTMANNTNFSAPISIRYSNKNYGKVFVADRGNNRVVIYGSELLGSEKTPVNASAPTDIAFTTSYMFSIDTTNHKVSLHNPANGDLSMNFGKLGAGIGQFNTPISIFSNGYDLFVIEAGNNRMQVIRSGMADWLK